MVIEISTFSRTLHERSCSPFSSGPREPGVPIRAEVLRQLPDLEKHGERVKKDTFRLHVVSIRHF